MSRHHFKLKKQIADPLDAVLFNIPECEKCGVTINCIDQSMHFPNDFKLKIPEIANIKREDITEDGYSIVYISNYFYDTLEKALFSISRHYGNDITAKTISLRDEPAKIEFRKGDFI